MADTYLNNSGLSRYDTKIKEYIDEIADNIFIYDITEPITTPIIDVKNAVDDGKIMYIKKGNKLYPIFDYIVNVDQNLVDGTVNFYYYKDASNVGAFVNADVFYESGDIGIAEHETNIQYELTSGTDIKTINNESLLGSGNISLVTQAEIDTILEDYVKFTDVPTENKAGPIKLNPSQNIGVDANGKLIVGGRMGQFDGTTGLFAPNDREPRAVGDYSLLITDAKGMDIGNRAFAVVSGYGLACKSAAAGSTQYRITNNYANRIIAKMCENGYISRDEATSKAEKVVPVVSVQINGSSFTPDSSANSSNDIIITTAETLNPDSAITNIRLFGKMQAYATIHTGNGIASWGGGRNLILGGAVTKAGSSNDNCLVGMNIYSSGNGNACFGRQHIAIKNRGLLAGTGHDTTNAPAEGASAVGQFSYMDGNTLFAVGNGTSHTVRSNAFEVRTDGIVIKSPNRTRFKITVDDSGNLATTPL